MKSVVLKLLQSLNIFEMKGFFAAIMMFTRLPLWRIVQVEKQHYAQALTYWPLVGFLTGTTLWGVWYLASSFLPAFVASLLAIIARIWLTGALHEDGLADFFDGFGGGNSKENILSIMKDSHIGSYGTIGLILYFMLYTTQLQALPIAKSAGIIIGADVFSKLFTAIMINSLPYARTEESSKTKVLYQKITPLSSIAITLFCIVTLWWIGTPLLAIVPLPLVVIGFRQYFKRKIGGYTGDCCGATVLFAEQCFYLSSTILYFSSFLS